MFPGSRFCGVCGAALAAPPPYAGYGTLPPPRKNNTALIVVIVVVLVVIVPIAASAILYVLVSGLIQPPTQNPSPSVSLVLSTASSTGATLLVAGSQPPPAPAGLRLNLEAGGEFGAAVNLPGTPDVPVDIRVTGYATPFTVRWVDVGGDGLVNGGDQFVIAYPTVLSSGTTLTFLLIWYDGSVVSTVSWST